MRYFDIILFIAIIFLSLNFIGKKGQSNNTSPIFLTDTTIANGVDSRIRKKDSVYATGTNSVAVATVTGSNGVNPVKFVDFASKYIGTPYVWGSVNPAVGFDCSGFINHVSKHFGLAVPRSSVEFTNYGTEIELSKAQPGDFILFKGTDPNSSRVGHMGIITENPGGSLKFIHSTSGKKKGVTISDLEGYYETRFVKIIRIPGMGQA